jgi:hypothetical protein
VKISKKPHTSLFAVIIVAGMLASRVGAADTLHATSGGTFAFNLDRDALAPYVFGSALGNNGYYLANFWDTSASDYANPSNSASYFIGNVGNTEIPAVNLVLDVTATGSDPTGQASGRHVVATTVGFGIDSNTLEGMAGEKLGMTGIQGFYAPNYPGRVVNGDFSLQYDATRQTSGRSGWFLANNISFTMAVYDLANLNLTVSDANNWQLSGDLWMAPENADMLLGPQLADVGSFQLGVGSYTVSAVPIPAAAWLFASGILGLVGVVRRRAMGA